MYKLKTIYQSILKTLTNQMASKIWYPSNYLCVKTKENTDRNKYAIIILNRPIKLSPNLTIDLWNKACYRLVVDGGANRWLQFKNDHGKNGEIILKPDLVTGDFDSITLESKQLLEEMGTNFITTSDQDETDFTKALQVLNADHVQSKNISSVVVLLDVSGRIDHILSHINTLFQSYKFMPNVNVFILCKTSISWLLNAGTHTIHIPNELVEQQVWCSHVPIGSACKVTTTGLKWDLENQIVQFGGIISTSNTYKSNLVTIVTDGSLYWSMGLQKNDED